MALRCVIVDDNDQFLEAARDVLERDGLTVVGVATNYADAIARISELRPDVSLIDVCLGDECGLRLAEDVVGADAARASDVILVSTYAESDFDDLIEDSPALAFVSKSDLSGEAIFQIMKSRGRPAAGGD